MVDLALVVPCLPFYSLNVINERCIPDIIQGGMGVGVSGYRLANAVAREGALGVVSGTGVGIVLARRLQQGHEDSLRSLRRFPDQSMAQRVLDRYFIPGGKSSKKRFKPVPMWRAGGAQRSVQELIICGNFVEVDLAKEGHSGQIGINYLEKIQYPHLLSLFGAMLAGVDVVLMGAGIPLHIAGIIEQLSRRQPVRYGLDVISSQGTTHSTELDPASFGDVLAAAPLSHPAFLAIISSDLLAKVLETRSSARIAGYIVEAPTAGGHNAPPRNKALRNDRGEPVYGEKDQVNFEKLNALGVAYWLAGSVASPAGLAHAKQTGAKGIQVGSAFALAEESGLLARYKAELRCRGFRGILDIRTDPLASPSGYPFKVAQVEGTLADPAVLSARPRICDIGYLREMYDSGSELGLRCPSEPPDDFVAKGGRIEDTTGRICLCNGLFAAIGLGQIQPKTEYIETPVLTLGDDTSFLHVLMRDEDDSYGAADVLRYLRSPVN